MTKLNFKKPHSVEAVYYTHGLVCASYPRTVIAFVALAVILCSLPFFITSNGELFMTSTGTTPKPWRSPWLNYRVPVRGGSRSSKQPNNAEWIINNATLFSGRTPSWFIGLPVAVIQQLYVHLEVNCQEMDQLCQRSYYGASKITSALFMERLKQVVSTCRPVIHPAAVKFTGTVDVPLTGGVLSPLLDTSRNSWEDGEDSLPYQTTKEVLYGGFWEHRHAHFVQDSQDTKSHSFAITFLLQPTTETFEALTNCVNAIKTFWREPHTTNSQSHFMKHLYYEPAWHIMDFAPLLGVYFIVFLYITFSVGKIDLVQSKFWLGFAAFITVVASLVMSLGICSFFGLSISLSGSEIYPFVVVIIGLENILIIVKAVMSTPEEFEVKERIAAGLSKEGLVITRNVLTLSFMLGMGIIVFNYTLKEFCIIAFVGLLCDYFLQVVFFPTVLSIDLRRLEVTPLRHFLPSLGTRLIRSITEFPLFQLSDLSPAMVAVEHTGEGTPAESAKKRCPTSLSTPARWRSRRVKFAYFLANYRLVSRALMVGIVAYLLAWFCHTNTFQQMMGLVGSETNPSNSPGEQTSQDVNNPTPPVNQRHTTTQYGYPTTDLPDDKTRIIRLSVDGFGEKCEGSVCWRPMVTTHWPRLLRYYGYDMEGSFLTVLPPISLHVQAGFEAPHHPPDTPTLYHSTLHLLSHPYIYRGMFIVAWLGTLAVYFTWLLQSSRRRHEKYQRIVRSKQQSARVVCIKGHKQDIECLCVENGLVVSASLDGEIQVWDPDPMRKRCLLTISRSEVCGEFPEGPPTIYKSRPDAEGCEATAESQSVSGTIPTPPPVKKPQRPINTSDARVQRKQSVPNSTTTSPRMMTKSLSLQEVPPVSTTTSRYQRLHSVPPSPTNPNNGVTRPRSYSTQSAQEATPQLYKLPSLAGIPCASIPSSSTSSSSHPAISFPTTTIHKSSHHKTSTPPNPVPSTMASKMMAPPPPRSALTTSNESQLRARHASAVASPQPMETNRLSSHRPGHSRHNSLTSNTFPTRSSHSRNSSLGAISHRSHSRNNSFGTISVGEISLLSNASSMHSINSVNIDSSSVVQPKTNQQTDPQTASNEGYNFARHFNLFSQFTSNMALEYCSQRTEETPVITAPPIWCMDVWNQVVAVGCGNGQIEAWNSTGSLLFCLSMGLTGVTTIAVNSNGIITGHMDGSLHLIGHNGQPQHCIQAHNKAISVMRCTSDSVVTGGYDNAVRVHRIMDFSCLNAVFIHNGQISALMITQPQGKNCVSGCSKGLVCCWERNTGNCVHEFEEYGSPVLKLEGVGIYLVALFADECVRVWESVSGYLVHTIPLDGVCREFAVLSPRYIAASLEIDPTTTGSRGCSLHRFQESTLLSQSQIAVYDVDSGQKHSVKPVEVQNRGVALVRHIVALEGTQVVCSVGKEVHIITCNIKLKNE